jgi:sugar lactone lactonase YvrE
VPVTPRAPEEQVQSDEVALLRADSGVRLGRRVNVAEVALEQRYLLGEGPLWDERVGKLVFVDILRGCVHRWRPGEEEVETFDVGATVGSLATRAGGGYILARGSGFATLDDRTGKVESLAPLDERIPGSRLNDGRCDPAGRFWAGTQADEPERRRSALYRLDADGSARRKLVGVGISNGLDWSADSATFYYADSITYAIDAFEFQVETGELGRRRRFVKIEGGMPDGLVIDEEDGLWVAVVGGACVKRYSPEGSLDAVVELPVSLVTSCAFGGEDLRDLYITTAAHRLREPEPLAGALFRFDPGVRGRPTHAFAG